MRELLFRGKDSEGNWKYGGIVHQTDFYGDPCDKYYIIDGTETQDYDIGYEYSVLPETVGQSTGLSDSNGNRIFESDILDFCLDILPDLVSTRFVGVVDFNGDAFCVRCNGNLFGLMDVLSGDDTLEVVGNIFDNPEKAEGLL